MSVLSKEFNGICENFLFTLQRSIYRIIDCLFYKTCNSNNVYANELDIESTILMILI